MTRQWDGSAGQAGGILICEHRRVMSRNRACVCLCHPGSPASRVASLSKRLGDKSLQVQERKGSGTPQMSCSVAGVALPPCAVGRAGVGVRSMKATPPRHPPCSDLVCTPANWKSARPPTTRNPLPVGPPHSPRRQSASH